MNLKLLKKQSVNGFIVQILCLILCVGVTPASRLTAAPVTQSGTCTVTISDAQKKLSRQLLRTLRVSPLPKLPWTIPGLAGMPDRVDVLILTSSSDPELTELRQAVINAGGTVYYKYLSVNGLWVVLPADQVIQIAQRCDVTRIVPNLTTRSSSVDLPATTGAASAWSYSSLQNETQGLDGSNVGIAILDSGIMKTHAAFADKNGLPRIKDSVDIMKAHRLVYQTNINATQPVAND